ncbi:MAM domain-containing glycosylphosphatidylinositol anchor protein 2-like isoform X2 [Lethenteron reissneri]|uniref:MAM domain-containing glycosylphosphatidylinositol anchor protein 2-like isoform X2 n=1 Tax=Lethenteron reissneri TaxID=7753 RepID=UPI002AB6AF26|nr:MAM domain-containing glycosylphosphatidylinositol anchor protein 2-like isoform X2 [Lethenteron reissneri]
MAPLALLPLLLGLTGSKPGSSQGVYAPPSARILAGGHACLLRDDGFSEYAYVIREGHSLQLTCVVSGHPRPQVRWTKTAGTFLERSQEMTVYNETMRINDIGRMQGGRYYCKADNGVGVPALRSVRVEVYYLEEPRLTVHQYAAATRQYFYAERTVFLRCEARSSPAARHTWYRGAQPLQQGADSGVDIYEPLFTHADTNILKLKNLRAQDYANYTCVVSVGSVCNIPARAAFFPLTRTTAPPVLEHPASEQLVVEPGERVRLRCAVIKGDPIPSVTWSRSPGGLPPTCLIGKDNLTIQSVHESDSGTYTCLVSNGVGGAVRRAINVTVRSLRRGRFWITPDPYHEDDNIQIGREVKISCQVEAVPIEELSFAWYRNGRMLRSSDRLLISKSDSDFAPGTSSLDIIDLRFTDFGTYTCTARLSRARTLSDISMDVNISSSTVPPTISVPRGRSPVVVREGSTADLQCIVSGKPKPVVLWSRVDRDALMPDGAPYTESHDGCLYLANVTRDMAGSYRCQTGRFNGFNVSPREATVQLIVQYPPVVEPPTAMLRQGLGQSVSMECRVLRANPARIIAYEWRFKGKVLATSRLDSGGFLSSHRISSLSNDDYGSYSCILANEAGSTSCVFTLTGRARAPEFYYDNPSPVHLQHLWVYSYLVQWTQAEPTAVDPVTEYRLEVRQGGQGSWKSVQVAIADPVQRGDLLSHNLVELALPHAHQLRLTPFTCFGPGDSAMRWIHYSDGEAFCGFEELLLCGFMQDTHDDFDWKQRRGAGEWPRPTPPPRTHSSPGVPGIPASPHFSATTRPFGLSASPASATFTDQRFQSRLTKLRGNLMYAEASQQGQAGQRARLISPIYNISGSGTSLKSACLEFHFHSRGNSSGMLNVLVRVGPNQDRHVWVSKGRHMEECLVQLPVNPAGPFQVVFEAVRGPGGQGSFGIDDVSISEGACPQEKQEATLNCARGVPAVALSASCLPLLSIATAWLTLR